MSDFVFGGSVKEEESLSKISKNFRLLDQLQKGRIDPQIEED